MDIRSWGVSKIVAVTVIYWAALSLVARIRNQRRIRRAMAGVDLGALEPDALTPVEGAPDMAVRVTGEKEFVMHMQFEERMAVRGLLLVLGPPVALFLLRYVFLA